MAEHIIDNEGYYQEKYRPQIHFSPQKNWMNDPNGLVYFQGEYHLFYQYNPKANHWGAMYWGHAVSKDLIYWEHLPIALSPDQKLGMAFSGSAVVDHHDSSGFFNGASGMVLIYTSAYKIADGTQQQQSIAYSKDRGRSWEKYQANPVIKNKEKKDFRDPKVFWHEQSQKWVMILAVGNKIEIYNSANLKEWNYLSEFSSGESRAVWECPDLFKLAVENQSQKELWVLKVDLLEGAPTGGSGGKYFIGDFNGREFKKLKQEKDGSWLDSSKDFYAAQSWSNIPASDARKIWLGWMSNWDYAEKTPTAKWRSAMTIPRVLKLIKKADDYLLLQKPIGELKKLREKSCSKKAVKIRKNDLLKFHNLFNPAEIELEFQLSKKPVFEVEINFKNTYLKLKLDSLKEKVILTRKTAKADFQAKFDGQFETELKSSKSLNLRLFVDWSSVEIFINDGEKVFSSLIFPDQKRFDLNIQALKEDFIINYLEIYQLKSIWN